AHESARREGGGGGGHRGRGRQRCECRRRCAGKFRRAAECVAAHPASHLAPGSGGEIPDGLSAAFMTIDAHAHHVPPALIAAVGSRGADFGVRLIQASAAAPPALEFSYGFKVRPFFPKLVETAGE